MRFVKVGLILAVCIVLVASISVENELSERKKGNGKKPSKKPVKPPTGGKGTGTGGKGTGTGGKGTGSGGDWLTVWEHFGQLKSLLMALEGGGSEGCIRCNDTCCEPGEVYIPCENGEECPAGYHCCGQFGCWKDGSGCPPSPDDICKPQGKCGIEEICGPTHHCCYPTGHFYGICYSNECPCPENTISVPANSTIGEQQTCDIEEGVCPESCFQCQTPNTDIECCGPNQICGCFGCWERYGGTGPVCPKCPTICPEIIEPICGVDNQTYTNKCFGCEVATACNGECPCKGICKTDSECPMDETCCPTEFVGGFKHCAKTCPADTTSKPGSGKGSGKHPSKGKGKGKGKGGKGKGKGR